MAENEAQKAKSNVITTKQRIILLVTCPLVVILLCSIAIVYTAHRLEPEEPEEIVNPLIGTEMPADAGMGIADFCDKILGDAAGLSDIKAWTDVNVSLHDFGGDFPEAVTGILGHISGQFSDAVKEKYEKPSLNYGEAGSGLLSLPAAAADCKEMTGEYRENDSSYAFTLELTNNAAIVADFRAEDMKLYEQCKTECADVATVADNSFELDSVTAYFNYDVSGEYITSFELVREYKADMNVTFTGDLESFGAGQLTFGCRVATKYNIAHAGISIGEDEIKLDKNGYQTLSISANIADDAGEGDFTVKFTSSDESVVKVDDNGMIEAVSVSEQPVTVTAELTYLGNTYSDSCTVLVTDED